MKSILVIPFWVQEQLNRNKLRLHELLEFGKARKVLSAHDMATAATAFTFWEHVIGVERNDNDIYPVEECSLQSIWRASATTEEMEELDRVLSLSYDPSIIDDLSHRLFTAESLNERHDQPFNTYDLTPETVAVVIYPGYFVKGAAFQDRSVTLLESVLRVFYAYDSHHEVAKHPCFKQYLRLLSSRAVIL